VLELAAALLLSLGATPEPPVAPKPPAIPKIDLPVPERKPPAAEADSRPGAAATGPGATDAGVATAPIPEVVAPPLSAAMLCEELRKSGRDQRAAREKLDGERAELAKERTRLEQLVAQIEKARAALRTETSELEQLAKGVHRTPPWQEPPPSAEPGKGPVETTARAIRAMKPDQAAVLVSRLDPRLAAAVLRRMRPADAGAVIERLRPELASALVTTMASAPAEEKR